MNKNLKNTNYKIAVPTREEQIDDHFGHCDHYTIYTIRNKEIIDKSTLPSPQGCGCKSGIAIDLATMGVTVMLAGNMGEGAKNKLNTSGITVIRGCSGAIDTVVTEYLCGKISDSGNTCSHHECGEHEHSTPNNHKHVQKDENLRDLKY